MNAEILDFISAPTKGRLGQIIVKYHDLVMKCDLVFFIKEQKAWIRMPEIWLNPTTKLAYCYWPNREISDNFQKLILNKLFEKYSLDAEKIKALHVAAAQKRKISKKARKDTSRLIFSEINPLLGRGLGWMNEIDMILEYVNYSNGLLKRP